MSMRGLGGMAVGACLYLVLLAPPAQAEWVGWSYAYYGPVYYVPVYYYYPAYPVCVPVAPTSRPAVTPQPAPAAKKAPGRLPAPTTKEPPVMGNLQKKGPVIIESRSGGTTLPERKSTERCKVGFWNLTGRNVTLTVDGQQQLLPKDRAVTLELTRSFVWQIDQRETVTERVPPDEAFHEVILRQ
jgi:hypothetical protein